MMVPYQHGASPCRRKATSP